MFPVSKWGKDRTASDSEDPDPEDQILAPKVAPNRGKTSVRPSVQNLSSDADDSDVEVLEVIEARPLRFSYPVPTKPADMEVPRAERGTVGGSRPAGSQTKRGEGRGQRDPPAKRRKVCSTGPPRQRPTFSG